MDQKDKVWRQLSTCWTNLSQNLDQIKDQFKTQLTPIKQQCSTWLQGTSIQETVTIGGRDFRIVKKLGEGGYSFVLQVQEVVPGDNGDLGRSYALKKVLADRHTLADARKEMNLMQQLNHPNLLPLLESAVQLNSQSAASSASHIVYMLFPLFEGGNLWDFVQTRILQQRSPLTPVEIIHVSQQLCAGLQHMHARGVVHWDVKPHNVLLSQQASRSGSASLKEEERQIRSLQNSRAVLIDFGSARTSPIRVGSRQEAMAVQEDAERHCTAPYRPPELWDVSSSCVIDSKVDVWSLGCVVYYMMVGESPFEKAANEAGGSLMLAVVNGNIPWPEDIMRRYPEALRAVVAACLRGEPEQRPGINEVAALLEDVRRSSGR